MTAIDFRTAPERYRHWQLSIEGSIATLGLDVDADGGLAPGYELKLNSYDLGVDIELNDAIQRLRFEHPEVHAVIITSAKERVFCAGANIGMLSTSSHAHKVNFCKFTNETRLALEDASAHSGQRYMCAINGPCAGGGYELALAADHLILLDDGASAVSLPEIPLLAVLPGTGGLTRLVDKRRVRRDRADFFCTVEEGVRGKRALDWRLVDAVVPRSKWQENVAARAAEMAATSDRPADATGIVFSPLERTINSERIEYSYVGCVLDRDLRAAHITVRAPADAPPSDLAAIHSAGAAFWPLAVARELEDLIFHLRFNESEIGTWVMRTAGESALVAATDAALAAHADDWLVREITLYLKRTLKRLDLSARSIFAFIEPGSCFTGTLLELALAADRSYMLDGAFEGDNRAPATIAMTSANYGLYPMANGLSRLQSRFLGDAEALTGAEKEIGRQLDALEAEELGLVTFAPDDIDWEDETRIALEERAAFSPDALTGMEASLRFAGPETMESKIFSRLTAWQNWIFQRPNAVGETGTLKLYGSGKRPQFDKERV
ncbi:MAG: Benzoyl-CoA-dihydrodiol lyase [Alphaproteobacteria bacterium MarineAlpha10_Bin1]|nr:MAG: Benzoyl-CoA-dihydrodiol lyase [Alphaproteobacteria bacterium MarineAlpha10_Bin1]